MNSFQIAGNHAGNDSFGQVFITDTQQERIERLFAGSHIDHRNFCAVSGQVHQFQA